MKEDSDKLFFRYDYSANVNLLLESSPKKLIHIVKGSYILIFLILTTICLKFTYPVQKSGAAYVNSSKEVEINIDGSDKVDPSELSTADLTIISDKSHKRLTIRSSDLRFNGNSIAFGIDSSSSKFCHENLGVAKTPVTLVLGKKTLLSIILKRGR